jgi:hypothetical protein
MLPDKLKEVQCTSQAPPDNELVAAPTVSAQNTRSNADEHWIVAAAVSAQQCW